MKGVVGVAQAGSNAIQSIANTNNVSGAVIGGMGNLSNTLGSAGKSVASSESGNMGLAKGLLVGSGALAAATAILKGGDALANAYADSLEGQDALLRSFGGSVINLNSVTQNSDLALKMRTNALNKSTGTGMETDAFIQLASSLGAYGITGNNGERAMDIARQSAMWSRFTGADASQIANFAGLIERYGGNGNKAIETAFGAARASGLDKSQFSEFLSGLESVVENGISKGFIRSADDVSESLANLSLLSGNSQLWSGRNGAQRYQSMSNAMSNATSLTSTSSMLLYRAMSNTMGGNADWIDVMSEIEKGNFADPKFLSNYKAALEGAYGSDKASAIATIKENFGLNYTGAKDFYDNILNSSNNLSPNEIQNKIKEYQENPEFKSDSANMADSLNQIENAVIQMSKNPFNLKYGSIDKIGETIDNIYSYLTQGEDRETKEALKEYEEDIGYAPFIDNSLPGGFAPGTWIDEDVIRKQVQRNKKGYKYNPTQAEIDAYDTMVEAAKVGVSDDDMAKFFTTMSKAVTGNSNKNDYEFNSEVVVIAIKELQKSIENLKIDVNTN